MCGINGLYNFSNRRVEAEKLKAMNQLLFHRGPDEEGYYIDGSFGMSIRRLSIIDLTTGSQPLSNEDGTLWVTLNGEIYNYIELRKELRDKGHVFKTNTDTEVLLHLYEESGRDLLGDLNGIFAFAIWDCRKKELFIARDRMGVKPLFYFHTKENFGFSSELKSLLRVLPFTKEVYSESFLLYLLCMYVPEPLSIVKGISKLEAGHYLLIDRIGNVIKKRYWDLPPQKNKSLFYEEEAKDYLSYLLKDSVRLQLRSDVPVGIFLSGGIDSSAVTALASEISSNLRKTFSLTYEGHHIDESPYARKVAEIFDMEHHDFFLKSDDVVKNLPEMIWAMDEPFSDSAAISTYLLSKLARQSGVKVVLSGAGGDEVFAGYERYNLQWIALLKKIWRFHTKFGRLRNKDWILDYICAIGCGRGLEAFFEKNRIDLNGFYRSFHDITGTYRKTANLSLTHLYSKRYLDMKMYLTGDLLMLLDKMTMGASIEGRVPLLDHRIVEFMFTLPDKFKIAHNRKKYLLKEAMKSVLPSSILNRSKMGFGAPVSYWIQDIVVKGHERNIFGFNEFLPDKNKKVVYKFLLEEKTHSQILFALLIFNMWHENVFKKIP